MYNTNTNIKDDIHNSQRFYQSISYNSHHTSWSSISTCNIWMEINQHQCVWPAAVPEGSLIVIPPDLSSCFSRLFLNLPFLLSGIGFVGISVCWRIIMLISRSIRSSSRIRSCSSRRWSSCSCAFCWFNNLFSSSSRRFSSWQTNNDICHKSHTSPEVLT